MSNSSLGSMSTSQREKENMKELKDKENYPPETSDKHSYSGHFLYYYPLCSPVALLLSVAPPSPVASLSLVAPPLPVILPLPVAPLLLVALPSPLLATLLSLSPVMQYELSNLTDGFNFSN
ncbi:hypothetical protein BC937DRAFT_89474 [Endogone sp. FLAS-F59071]|nr:hypothetical protein BC937DRAFT_89474 [Endogone sp. FLAS-F59071]|eukprot:RUS17812.1 hypothetical protein BC937DRAFT_89474 [Endogone sp. FLAS-F59071]